MTSILVTTETNYDDSGIIELTGTITTSTSSAVVTGIGTNFSSTSTGNTPPGTPIYAGPTGDIFIGIVQTFTSATSITLTENAAAEVSDQKVWAHRNLSLLNGESFTVRGGVLTIDSDTRWNQQSAVFSTISYSSSAGGSILVDGTKVWELYFDSSTGTVPTQTALNTNQVVGSGGATGELMRVWQSGSLIPLDAGAAMPTSGWIKLRYKSGNFSNDEVVTLPNGATITLTGPGKRSWINVVGTESSTNTVGVNLPRLGQFKVTGDWYELGTTNGTDNQTFTFPLQDEIGAIQIETAPGSNTYEWWMNGAQRWINNGAALRDAVSSTGVSAPVSAISGPPGAMPGGQYSSGKRITETAVTGSHFITSAFTASNVSSGAITGRTFLKRSTRQWGGAQIVSSTLAYSVTIDLDTGTVVDERSVGATTGTSHTVTDVGNGWYCIEVTLGNHTFTNGGGLNIFLADSATPTFDANGRPTYLGVTSESMFYAESQIIVDGGVWQIGTDERGKYCYSDATTGTITIAARGTKDIGYKPPSGCKVRVPNVVLSSADVVDYSRNVQTVTFASRYEFLTTTGGAIDLTKTVCNWYIAAVNPAYVTLQDNAHSCPVSLSNVAGSTLIDNCALGRSRSSDGSSLYTLTITNCFSGGTISNSKILRLCPSTTNTYASFLATIKDFTFDNCQFILHVATTAANVRQTALATINGTTSDNLTFNNCDFIGGGVQLATSNNIDITNMKYADMNNAATTAVAGIAALALTTCNYVTLDGFSSYYNIADVHPYTAIVSATTSCSNIAIKNIGTASSPYSGGSTNQLGLIGNFINTTTNIEMRNVYAQNIRTAALVTALTVQNLRAYNVWSDGEDVQTLLAIDALCQGCRWKKSTALNNSVYGTHWEDAFISTTDGAIHITANEPIASTSNQCSGTFGTGSGFTSTGTVSLSNLTDEVIWTMPYYALGHNSIARFTSGVSGNHFLAYVTATTSTNVQNLEFSYQIDKGSGFSSWKHLLNCARRDTSGGTTGTFTVNLNATDVASFIRVPQPGDYVQAVSSGVITTTRLPIGTTVVSLDGTQLTVSQEFLSSVGTGDFLYFWKDISDEVIDPATGYKLKVRAKANRITPNDAATPTVLAALRIPFDTDATSQLIAYPPPVETYDLIVSNIVNGSRLLVRRTDTNAVLVNETVSAGSYTYTYEYSANIPVEIVIRKATSAPFYQEWRTITTLTNADNNQTALQVLDT